MTNMNIETLRGTVHAGRMMTIRSRVYDDPTTLAPICRKFSMADLHLCIPVDKPVTCKRCLTKLAKQS